MSLPVDTQQLLKKVWTDSRGTEFRADKIHDKEGVMWVEYHRVHDNSYYNCLLSAFTARLSPKEPKQ